MPHPDVSGLPAHSRPNFMNLFAVDSLLLYTKIKKSDPNKVLNFFIKRSEQSRSATGMNIAVNCFSILNLAMNRKRSNADITPTHRTSANKANLCLDSTRSCPATGRPLSIHVPLCLSPLFPAHQCPAGGRAHNFS